MSSRISFSRWFLRWMELAEVFSFLRLFIIYTYSAANGGARVFQELVCLLVLFGRRIGLGCSRWFGCLALTW
ncbi:hypothetical protein B0T14DRAFT_191776 [Immersiella caudata]|uniref:Uncharacterized protein n=1 Tax=Immersiella caudata TaxID=314043 RepID=A0AA40C3F8_9PEZI|nr:hypothetical protein B0T14DRAFT_191776 [Immersiella caudata]